MSNSSFGHRGGGGRGHGGHGHGRRWGGWGGYYGAYPYYGYGLPVVYDYREDPLEDGLFSPVGGEDGEAVNCSFPVDDYMTYMEGDGVFVGDLAGGFHGDLDIHDDGNLLTIRHKHR